MVRLRLRNGVGLDEVSLFLGSLYFERRIHTLMVLSSLEDLASKIFESVNIRDYVLEMADDLGIKIAQTFESEAYVDQSFVPHERLINTLVVGLTLNKPYSEDGEPSKSLIPHGVLSTLTLNPETLKVFLKDNFWIIGLLIVISNFHQTHFFEEFASKLSSN
jgi:hypothetical protein